MDAVLADGVRPLDIRQAVFDVLIAHGMLAVEAVADGVRNDGVGRAIAEQGGAAPAALNLYRVRLSARGEDFLSRRWVRDGGLRRWRRKSSHGSAADADGQGKDAVDAGPCSKCLPPRLKPAARRRAISDGPRSRSSPESWSSPPMAATPAIGWRTGGYFPYSSRCLGDRRGAWPRPCSIRRRRPAGRPPRSSVASSRCRCSASSPRACRAAAPMRCGRRAGTSRLPLRRHGHRASPTPSASASGTRPRPRRTGRRRPWLGRSVPSGRWARGRAALLDPLASGHLPLATRASSSLA